MVYFVVGCNQVICPYRFGEDKDKEGHYIRKERYYGNFARSFYVGEAVTQEDIKAAFKDGILTLNVPKKEKEEKVEEKKLISIE